MMKENKTQRLKEKITLAQNYLLAKQAIQGYWWAELESNVTITAEVVLLHKIWGTKQPLEKVEFYLRSQQREHGGWELFALDGGDLSTSIEAYMALRLLGVKKSDPALQKAAKFIIERGGISKSRVFTKIHLALIGCYEWSGIPSIPAWIMLLPDWFPFTIYEMSSWARSSTVPLLLVFDSKPIYPQGIDLDELLGEGKEQVSYQLPLKGDASDIFIALDGLFKLGEQTNLIPWRTESLAAAEKWVIERQEESGDWGGIIPAMLNSLLALRAMNYSLGDPIVQRGLKAVDNFALETADSYRVQPCISPVWDTAWALRALRESGLAEDDPRLVKAGEWLLDKQIVSQYGDWAVKNKEGKPGGWAFEFYNRFYPDIDDSAVVVMALAGLKLPNEALKQAAIKRCVEWIATMQSTKEGGWGAFDVDNEQNWLNELPYADLKAMIDPNTADVTARVIEMAAYPDVAMSPTRLKRALAYLEKEQEADGSWFGRWGVNYIYGTSGVLSALSLYAPKTHQDYLIRGVAWLVSCQNADGGWGETCQSYQNSQLKGTGNSTKSQTAWAIIGLLDAGSALGNWAKTALSRGIEYLLSQQLPDGSWDEVEFTGTGFPNHFYLKYHFYQQYFPLIALSRYQRYLEL